jgi:hypothetical protein
MLQITVPAVELYDEKNNRFINLKERTLQLEHSLVSVSKWEAKYCKPFISKTDKTDEEVIDYIRCMTITQNVDPEIYNYLTDENYTQIKDYIQDPMTATTFSDSKSKGKGRNKIVTAEVIYSWMISLQIPIEFQKWHLNRLITQIRACSDLNQPGKKMSTREIMSQNAALNAARRKRLNTRG